jgi:3-deoxy-7-phosphoheptulonate synthase
VAADLAQQVAGGSRSNARARLATHLVDGRQDSVRGREGLVYGQSVTDGCIGWDSTVAVIGQLADAVRTRRAMD